MHGAFFMRAVFFVAFLSWRRSVYPFSGYLYHFYRILLLIVFIICVASITILSTNCLNMKRKKIGDIASNGPMTRIQNEQQQVIKRVNKSQTKQNKNQTLNWINNKSWDKWSDMKAVESIFTFIPVIIWLCNDYCVLFLVALHSVMVPFCLGW